MTRRVPRDRAELFAWLGSQLAGLGARVAATLYDDVTAEQQVALTELVRAIERAVTVSKAVALSFTPPTRGPDREVCQQMGALDGGVRRVYCTEDRDHAGDHVARGMGGRVVLRWPR